MHHFNAWYLVFFPNTFNFLFSKTIILKFKFLKYVPRRWPIILSRGKMRMVGPTVIAPKDVVFPTRSVACLDI